MKGLKRAMIFLLVFAMAMTMPGIGSHQVSAAPKASASFKKTGNYRKDWLKGLDEWCTLMEKDASTKAWKYMTSQGEKTNYASNRKTQRYTNCALMVVHAMQYVGLLDTNQKFFSRYKTHSTVYCGKNCKKTIDQHCSIKHLGGKKTSAELIENGTLQKGDIICFYNYQHVAVYYGKEDGYYIWYDAGSSTTKEQKKGGYWSSSSPFKVKIAVTAKGSKAQKSAHPSAYQDSFLGKVNDIIRVDNKNYVVHQNPSAGTYSYKVSGGKLYTTFTVKNNCGKAQKLTITCLLGNAKGKADGKSVTKTVTLAAGATKTFSNLQVGSKAVTAKRKYLTIKITSGCKYSKTYYKIVDKNGPAVTSDTKTTTDQTSGSTSAETGTSGSESSTTEKSGSTATESSKGTTTDTADRPD